jgi:hypothetical protein
MNTLLPKSHTYIVGNEPKPNPNPHPHPKTLTVTVRPEHSDYALRLWLANVRTRTLIMNKRGPRSPLRTYVLAHCTGTATAYYELV